MFVLQVSTSVYTSCRNEATGICNDDNDFPDPDKELGSQLNLLRAIQQQADIVDPPYSSRFCHLHHCSRPSLQPHLAPFSLFSPHSPSIFEESSWILWSSYDIVSNLTTTIYFDSLFDKAQRFSIVFPSDAPIGSPSRRCVRVSDGNVGFMTVGVSTKHVPHHFQTSSSACSRCHFYPSNTADDSSWGAWFFFPIAIPAWHWDSMGPAAGIKWVLKWVLLGFWCLPAFNSFCSSFPATPALQECENQGTQWQAWQKRLLNDDAGLI